MLICSGFVGHWPRHSLWPALSTTQIAVIFCETSNPTKQVINDPPMVRITGQRRPDRGTIGRSGANRDYRMSTRVANLLEGCSQLVAYRDQAAIANNDAIKVCWAPMSLAGIRLT